MTDDEYLRDYLYTLEESPDVVRNILLLRIARALESIAYTNECKGSN